MAVPRIRADYDKLAEIARRFGGEADRTQGLLRDLRRHAQVLENGDWVGRGATAFYGEMSQAVLPAVQRMSAAFREAQQVTLQISRIMKEAEDACAALFKAAGADIPLGPAQMLAASIGLALSGLGPLGGVLKGLAVTLNPTLLKSFAALNSTFPNLVRYFPGRWVMNSVVPDLSRRNTTVGILMDMLEGKRGTWMVRFDGPHGGANFPHINLNEAQMRPGTLMRWLYPEMTRLRDPHWRVPPSVVEMGGKAGTVLGRIGRAAPWLAAGTDVIRLGGAFQSDGYTLGADTARTAGSVAGGWTGAWAGGEAGAAGGAAVGTLICPGVGTAVGGFVGAIGGAVAGGWGGSALGEKIVSLFQ